MNAAKTPALSSPVFVENVGQFDSRVLFQSLGGGPRLVLGQDAIWLTIVEPTRHGRDEWLRQAVQPAAEPLPVRVAHVRLSFVGASFVSRPKSHTQCDAKVSYLKGANPALWRRGVPAWSGVTYENLYPGLYLSLSGGRQGLTWRFQSRKRADLRQVRLRIEGCDKVMLRQASSENPQRGGAAALVLLTAVGNAVLPLIGVPAGRPMRPRIEQKDPAVFEVATPFVSTTPTRKN